MEVSDEAFWEIASKATEVLEKYAEAYSDLENVAFENIDNLTDNEKSALSTFQYQYLNGGISQWIFNGYSIVSENEDGGIASVVSGLGKLGLRDMAKAISEIRVYDQEKQAQYDQEQEDMSNMEDDEREDYYPEFEEPDPVKLMDLDGSERHLSIYDSEIEGALTCMKDFSIFEKVMDHLELRQSKNSSIIMDIIEENAKAKIANESER